MAEKHLIKAISGRFKKMPAAQRVSKVRKLASRSQADERFIRKTFPDLYGEAFQQPSLSADERLESGQPHGLFAKRN